MPSTEAVIVASPLTTAMTPPLVFRRQWSGPGAPGEDLSLNRVAARILRRRGEVRDLADRLKRDSRRRDGDPRDHLVDVDLGAAGYAVDGRGDDRFAVRHGDGRAALDGDDVRRAAGPGDVAAFDRVALGVLCHGRELHGIAQGVKGLARRRDDDGRDGNGCGGVAASDGKG